MVTFRQGPLMGVLNAGGVGKNRDSQRISSYRIDDWRNANTNCDGPLCCLPHRLPHISEFCLSQPVANNRRLILTYCAIEANYRQTQSITRLLCNSRATCDVRWSFSMLHIIGWASERACSLAACRNQLRELSCRYFGRHRNLLWLDVDCWVHALATKMGLALAGSPYDIVECEVN